MKIILIIVIIALTWNFSIGLNLKSTAEDCGSVYGCYKIPSECIDNCNFLIKWKEADDSTDFVISYKVASTLSKYIAIGFSHDEFMNDDSVVMCKRSASGEFLVQTYYNSFFDTELTDPANPSLGLSQISASLEQSTFTCSFRRLKKIDQQADRYFDLNVPKHILIARGATYGADEPGYHSDRIPGDFLVDFKLNVTITGTTPSTVLVKLHGIFMVIIWIFLATTGILVASIIKYISDMDY